MESHIPVLGPLGTAMQWDHDNDVVHRAKWVILGDLAVVFVSARLFLRICWLLQVKKAQEGEELKDRLGILDIRCTPSHPHKTH